VISLVLPNALSPFYMIQIKGQSYAGKGGQQATVKGSKEHKRNT
jgi:hypothetical protein